MGQVLITGFAIPYFCMGRNRPGFGEMNPYLSVWGQSSNKSVLVCFYSSNFCFLLWKVLEQKQVEGRKF